MQHHTFWLSTTVKISSCSVSAIHPTFASVKTPLLLQPTK